MSAYEEDAEGLAEHYSWTCEDEWCQLCIEAEEEANDECDK